MLPFYLIFKDIASVGASILAEDVSHLGRLGGSAR